MAATAEDNSMERMARLRRLTTARAALHSLALHTLAL